jgi:hypothetical protein
VAGWLVNSPAINIYVQLVARDLRSATCTQAEVYRYLFREEEEEGALEIVSFHPRITLSHLYIIEL